MEIHIYVNKSILRQLREWKLLIRCIYIATFNLFRCEVFMKHYIGTFYTHVFSWVGHFFYVCLFLQWWILNSLNSIWKKVTLPSELTFCSNIAKVTICLWMGESRTWLRLWKRKGWILYKCLLFSLWKLGLSLWGGSVVMAASTPAYWGSILWEAMR